MKISAVITVVCVLVAGVVHTALSMTTPSGESTSIADGCPSELSWEPYNQSCFLHLTEHANFSHAKESCEGLGVHLVYIGSKEENQFIQDFVGVSNLPVWIGLYRANNDFCLGDSCEDWMWLDGNELGYSRWATGPLESSGQCVFINSEGDWEHGRRCTEEIGYVCKQKRIDPVTILESTTTMRTTDSTETRSSAGNIAPTTEGPNEDGIDVPLVVGCVVGGLVFVGIITAAGVALVKCHRQSTQTEQQNDSKRTNSLTKDIDNNSSPRDLHKENKDGKTSQRNQSNVDKDIDSSPTDERKKYNKEDRPTEGVNGRFNRGYCYEDVEAEMTIEGFKRGPANSDISARGRELNSDNIYAEPIKKKDR